MESLWVKVVEQALRDVTYRGDDEERCEDRDAAVRWFEDQDEDFVWVCQLADLEVEKVLGWYRDVAQH